MIASVRQYCRVLPINDFRSPTKINLPAHPDPAEGPSQPPVRPEPVEGPSRSRPRPTPITHTHPEPVEGPPGARRRINRRPPTIEQPATPTHLNPSDCTPLTSILSGKSTSSNVPSEQGLGSHGQPRQHEITTRRVSGVADSFHCAAEPVQRRQPSASSRSSPRGCRLTAEK